MQEAGTGALELLKFPWQLSPGRPSSPRPAAPPAQPAAQAPPQGCRGARRARRHRPLTRHRSWGGWTAQAGATPVEDLAWDRRVQGSGWPSPPGFGGGDSAVDLAAWVRRARGPGWTSPPGFGGCAGSTARRAIRGRARRRVCVSMGLGAPKGEEAGALGRGVRGGAFKATLSRWKEGPGPLRSRCLGPGGPAAVGTARGDPRDLPETKCLPPAGWRE